MRRPTPGPDQPPAPGPRIRVPPMNYQDFDLLIDRVGENLRAQVLNSPAGQATAEFRLPF